MPEILPLDPGIHFLPNLVEISSVPSHVRALTMGKQIEVVEIIRTFSLSEYSLADIVQCSATHLHTLNITFKLETLQEFLQFLDSLCQFKNLVNFGASYSGPITPGRGSMSHQDLRFKVWDSLQHLARLRIFRMNNDWTYSFANTEFGCLIGAECDPNDRGHPSLELVLIGFLSQYWRVWVHGEGWKRRDKKTVPDQSIRRNAGSTPWWFQAPIKLG